MAGQRRMTRRRAAPARKFVWARRDFSAGTIVAAQSTVVDLLLSDFNLEYDASVLGVTVMRIRGLLEFEPAGAATAVGAVGIRTAATQSVASDATPVGPLTELHADWMSYHPLIWNDNDPLRQVPRIEFDVKSNRKINELGDTLALYVENPIVGVAVTMRGILSIGLKLP